MRTVPLAVATGLAFALSLQGQQTNQKKDGKVRAFVSDSQSWEMSGGFGVSDGSGGGGAKGGARPQTAEIIKTFGERCPQITVTMSKEKADCIVLLDHEGGKSIAKKDNKVVVFRSDGDSVFSHSTRSLGNAVKDACEAIRKDAGLAASGPTK